MPGRIDDPAGRPLLLGRKVIEEAGGRGPDGARILGRRSARLELRHVPTGLQTVLDADALTDFRTGAAAAWAAHYLAAHTAEAALLGTGRVARAAALACDHLLRPERIRAYSRTPERRAAFAEALRDRLRGRLELATSVPEAVRHSDLIIAAAPAADPLLTPELVAGADLVVAVEGDPRVALLAPELVRSGRLVPDDVAQAERSGSVAAVLARGEQPGWLRLTGRPATVADAAVGRLEAWRGAGVIVLSTGLAVVDLLVGAVVWHERGGPPPP